ncbi:MAG TPA: TauD/TfdA family dioxygenase [Ktedonobacteraceae bacterium]|nr:TauD/TfdA family dioxygenase [Ktedonobacteraceae bacterium]
MQQKPHSTSISRVSGARRGTGINLTGASLIKSEYLAADQPLPLVIQPALDGVKLPDWARNEREYLLKELARNGAILFRGFHIDSADLFEQFAQSMSHELFEHYGDLPHEKVSARVYSSTPDPADKMILFHNEGSHQYRWPMKIWFYCVKPAVNGGATPIVDGRSLYQLLNPQVAQRIQEKKLMYVRNFIEGLDVSWQQFFGTSEKLLVEEACRRAKMDYEWKGESHLRTRQICPAILKHPITGEMIFFNQLQLHHISCLEPQVRESILSMFQKEDLPRNVYYGDGTPLEDEVVAEISSLYERLATRFQWQAGDILMLDNMLVAHSRDPFEGARKILVTMAELHSQADLPAV